MGANNSVKVRSPTHLPKSYHKIEVKKVTVAGVTGAIGPTVIEALCNAGFEVQALTRINSTAKSTHAKIKVVEVDYTDQKTLVKVLAGQDAVISTLGDTNGAVVAQEALIAAAVAVGVKRFIPSEFGSDTTNERVRSFPFFKDKARHQDLLKKEAAEHPGFTYTLIITGPFLDWGLKVVPFIINFGTRSAEVFDGGDVPFSTTRVTTLGKAVVSTLKNFEATANRTLRVHDAVITQNQLITTERNLGGGDEQFTKISVDCKTLEEKAWQSFEDVSTHPLSWMLPFINISIWSSEGLCVFDESDNALLGIPQLEGSELEDVLNHEIATAMKVFLAGAPDSPLSCRALAERAFEDGRQKLID